MRSLNDTEAFTFSHRLELILVASAAFVLENFAEFCLGGKVISFFWRILSALVAKIGF